MKKRIALALAAALLLVLGVGAGAAWASASTTTTELGSAGFSIDVKQITVTYTDLAWGESLFKAGCPTDYKPIGGGGFAYLPGTNVHTNLLTSAPYDQGELGGIGWGVMYNIPSSSWVVFVYATCMKIGG